MMLKKVRGGRVWGRPCDYPMPFQILSVSKFYLQLLEELATKKPRAIIDSQRLYKCFLETGSKIPAKYVQSISN